MHDVFMVTSERSGGAHIARTVYAADEDDARQTHQENYADEPIVEVHEAAQDEVLDEVLAAKLGVRYWRHVRQYTTARIADEARPEAAAGQQDRGSMGSALVVGAFWAILASLPIWCGIAAVVVWLLGR